MKRYTALVLTVVMLFFVLAGCTAKDAGDAAGREPTADGGGAVHKIGVATYNVRDAQIRMFKEYLDNYIGQSFSDVEFLYSDTISSGEEMMDFLGSCAENGVEGIMLFNSYDLEKEIEFCAEKKMYAIRPAGTFSDEEFDVVASNPYFLGQIGPGIQNEYEEGAKMARAMAGQGKSYVICSGGAFMGNEMHRQRTVAMLDVLQEVHGVSLDQDSETLAMAEQVTEVKAGGLELVICPGYLDIETFGAAAAEVIASGAYTTVLSSIPVSALTDTLNSVDIECGVIDCFSDDNYQGFRKGKIHYVAGKYESEIGPGFAALYNAITGNAELYRVDGKAFKLEQGFWIAKSASEYDSMYGLARGVSVNAYNYEDLRTVIKVMNPEADFTTFRTLVESYGYDDCLERRSN